MRRFKTFDDYESKPAELFSTPESRERFFKAMEKAEEERRLNEILANESAKKIWIR